jgi:hypothetical protein
MPIISIIESASCLVDLDEADALGWLSEAGEPQEEEGEEDVSGL